MMQIRIVISVIYLFAIVYAGNAANSDFKVHWINNAFQNPSTVYLYAHGFMATHKQALDMFTCYKNKNHQNPYWNDPLFPDTG